MEADQLKKIYKLNIALRALVFGISNFRSEFVYIMLMLLLVKAIPLF